MPSPLASLTLLLLPLALDAATPPAVFECGAANYHWEGCSSADGLCRSWQYAAPRPTVSEECVHACEGVLQLFPSPPKGPDVDIASAYPLDRIFRGYRAAEIEVMIAEAECRRCRTHMVTLVAPCLAGPLVGCGSSLRQHLSHAQQWPMPP